MMNDSNSIMSTNLSEAEFAKRLMESSLLFSDILPIYYEEQRKMFRLAFDLDIAEMIPDFFKDLSRYCVKHREETLPFIVFIREACDYILGIRHELPNVDCPTDEIKLKVEKQLRGWKLNHD